MSTNIRHAMRRARMGLQSGFGFKMSASNGEATIDIYDQIGSDGWDSGITAKQFKLQLAALGDVSKITLRMDSPGGYVMDGFTIYNLLCEHPAEITGIVDGMAASIASVILMACDRIIMKPLSFIMIHKPFSGSYGNSDQLRGDAELLDKMEKMAIGAYQDKTGLSEAKLTELMAGSDGHDATWMTPEDAIDYGFADEIDAKPSDRPKNRAINKGKLKIPDAVLTVMEGRAAVGMRMLAPKQAFRSATEPQKTAHEPLKTPENTQKTGVNSPLQGVDAMKCPKCGKEHSADATFCSACGQNMKADPTAAQQAAHDREVAEAKAEAAKNERERVTGIQALCQKFGMKADFEAELISGNVSLEKAAQKVADNFTPVAPGVSAGVNITADASDKFIQRATLSLMMQSKESMLTAEEKTSLKGAEHVQGLHGLARECLFNEGVVPARQIASLNPSQVADHFIRLAGATSARMEASSELANILADVANKVLDRQASLAAVTYSRWTGVVQSKDFKPLHMTNLSEFSDIKDIAEGQDFEFGRVADRQETVSIGTKGIAHVLTRKTIINDDLGALTRIPAAIANAWERRKNKDVYDLLTSAALLGPTMNEDSVALFNAATHKNLRASSGTVTHAAIGANRLAMQMIPLQAPDAKSVTQYSGYEPKFLVTGVNNRTSIEQLLGSTYDPGVANSSAVQSPNLFKDIMPVCDPYLQSLLTAASAPNAWYMFTDPTIADHFVVSYLQGMRVPYIRSMPSLVSQALGIKWDIFGEYGIGVANWRTGIYNDGK